MTGFDLYQAPFDGINVIGYEALCLRCHEIFNPADPEDLEHLLRHDETPCGGKGELVGAWGTKKG